MTAELFVRSYPLEDIKVRSGGDGRTVEAYAAVFNTPAEIRDQDGHYTEEIDPSAFKRTLNNRGSKFGVFYNHGLTIHGTPSDAGSIPIGTPLEVRADSRGLLTVTRYNSTPLAEAVLEAINTGAITAQSFTGRFMRSVPVKVPRKGTMGKLPTVTRTEIDLREYGPTPFPAYQEAMITGVRAALGLDPYGLRHLADRDPRLQALLAQGLEVDELTEAIRHLVLNGSLGATVPPDEPDGSRTSDTPPPADSSPQGTPVQDPPAGDPAPATRDGHSTRRRVARIARKVKLEG